MHGFFHCSRRTPLNLACCPRGRGIPRSNSLRTLPDNPCNCTVHVSLHYCKPLCLYTMCGVQCVLRTLSQQVPTFGTLQRRRYCKDLVNQATRHAKFKSFLVFFKGFAQFLLGISAATACTCSEDTPRSCFGLEGYEGSAGESSQLLRN